MFTPVADAYVRSDMPATNYGAGLTIRVDGAPVVNSYLRFDMQGLSGNVTSATLRIFANSAQAVGFNVHAITSATWGETAVTYSNAPAISGTVTDSSGPVTAGNTYDLDVTSLVAENGLVNFALTTPYETALSLASRESANDPQLIVTTNGLPIPAAPVVVGAGDIACQPGSAPTIDTCRQQYVADRISAINPVAVLDLGDIQYYCGSLSEFSNSYDLSWGRFKVITKPAIGNHEYITASSGSNGPTCTSANAGARGYFDYFTRGVASPLDSNQVCSTPGNSNCKGYYSYDIGTWHLIALNSNCGDAGGCSPGSPQHNWLAQDLATHPNGTFRCTLAYWHIPLFSSGPRHELNAFDLYSVLYDNDADVILTGHEHNYERFAPQNHAGVADQSRGIRQFIVGTGGANFTFFGPIASNSEFRDSSHFGVLKLTLRSDSYDWQFVGENGTVYDSGTTNCH